MTEVEIEETIEEVKRVENLLEIYEAFMDEYPKGYGDRTELLLEYAKDAEKFNSLVYAARNMLTSVQADLDFYLTELKKISTHDRIM